ncbi:MAG TPA: serine/threonine-protein kinase [Candidatus Obscuribacterales bacterium]
MADLEITIKYNSKPAKLALSIVVLLLPIWGILVPGLLIWMLFGLLTNLLFFSHIGNDSAQLLGIFLGLLLIVVLGVKAVLNLADNRIVLSKLGIELPFFLGNTFGLKRTFAWAAIRQAQLIESETKREIILCTTDGFPVYLDVKCMANEELEQLLLGLDVWAVNCEKSPQLQALQDELQETAGKRESPSYTAMWEEELSRRYSSTAYVPLEPGQELQQGRIKVLNQLSFGGLSAVYLCQRHNRDLVVLKEAVVPTGTDDEIEKKAKELFEREASILMKLDHPAIARVVDYFVDRGRHYLMIEYHSGQDLSQLVHQHGPQNEERVLRWALAVLDILSYLHGEEPPVIHRDVTPDNLVLKNDGSLVLIDFGAANEFLGTATGTLVGKQSFIAPEQFRGKASTKSDLYALGCTLHFLVTGKEPVPLSVSHPRAVNENLSEGVDKLVASLTMTNPDERIESAQEAKAWVLSLLEKSGERAEMTTI